MKQPSVRLLDPTVLSVTLILDILTIIAIIYSIFARSYHYTGNIFLNGSALYFDVGLIKVYVSGYAAGMFGKYNPKVFTRAIESAISTLNGRYLAEFELYACFIHVPVFSFSQNACEVVTTLRFVSTFFLICLVASATVLSFAMVVLLLAVTLKQNVIMRRVAFFLHLLPGCLVLTGALVYLIVGGPNINFLPLNLILHVDVSVIDLSSGYFIGASSAVLSFVSPIILHFSFFLTEYENMYIASRFDDETEDIQPLIEALVKTREML